MSLESPNISRPQTEVFIDFLYLKSNGNALILTPEVLTHHQSSHLFKIRLSDGNKNNTL